MTAPLRAEEAVMSLQPHDIDGRAQRVDRLRHCIVLAALTIYLEADHERSEVFTLSMRE